MSVSPPETRVYRQKASSKRSKPAHEETIKSLKPIKYMMPNQIRRQREGWQQAATTSFARGRIGDGLKAYQQQGAVHTLESKLQAIASN